MQAYRIAKIACPSRKCGFRAACVDCRAQIDHRQGHEWRRCAVSTGLHSARARGQLHGTQPLEAALKITLQPYTQLHVIFAQLLACLPGPSTLRDPCRCQSSSTAISWSIK